MNYLKTLAELGRLGIIADDVADVLEALADEMEDLEPQAVNTIADCRKAADAIRFIDQE